MSSTKTVIAIVATLGVLYLLKTVLECEAPRPPRPEPVTVPPPTTLPATTLPPTPTEPPCDSHATGNLDCRTGTTRKYELPMCKLSYTIPELNYDFAAHQVEWNIMGKTSAFWSVLTQFPKNDSDVTPEMIKKFYASGPPHVREVTAEMRQQYTPEWKVQGDVLDFGCGLGRLGSAFAQQPDVTAVTCVEQSVHHVLKTKKFVDKSTHQGEFYPIVSGPDLLGALRQHKKVPRCYDLVHTAIVMQHMIAPLMTVYLEQFCDALKPGGTMWVQVPYQTPLKPACTAAERQHYNEEGGMQMHYIGQEDVVAILGRRGCEAKSVDVGVKYIGGGAGWGSQVVYAQKRADHPDPCRF
jgi:SAM-dependent methyltransferase